LTYYYRKNLFGDIVEIYDDENQLAASYTYDAWGNFTVGTNVDGIAFVNKFRYRGYYYDSDTGYYYLQTRYYDPQVGRFINADSIEYLDPETINGCNLYVYCKNNPIMGIDPMGTFLIKLIVFIASIIISFNEAVEKQKETDLAMELIEKDIITYAECMTTGGDPKSLGLSNEFYDEYVNETGSDLPYLEFIAQIADKAYYWDYGNLTHDEIISGAHRAIRSNFDPLDDFKVYRANIQVRGVLEIYTDIMDKILKKLFGGF